MAIQRRPLGQPSGPAGRPPSQGGGMGTSMGGGARMPTMDTATPRHLASAMPMGPQGPPSMQMAGGEAGPNALLQDPNSPTGMLGDGGVLMRLLAMLGGRG